MFQNNFINFSMGLVKVYIEFIEHYLLRIIRQKLTWKHNNFQIGWK
jgi:hypothetical protein